jgi:hypothetical protein
MVGRGGFEPPKAYADRFTVCSLWPLGNLPDAQQWGLMPREDVDHQPAREVLRGSHDRSVPLLLVAGVKYALKVDVETS